MNTLRFIFCTLFFAAIAVSPLAAQANPQPEKMPEFPGGIPALMEYLGKNIRYPEEARKANAEGMIVVKFTVDAKGKIAKVHTVNEGPVQRPDLVKEAIRVVKSMPRWTPAEDKGKKVSCEMALPVKFKLS